jgi:hypothetical protein
MGTKAWVALAIVIGLGATNLAVAADWSVVPSITQKSEFNSNLNLTYAKPLSDYILSLQPAADFNYISEISQLQGHLGLNGQHYITNSNLDHIDQNYQINGKYQATPKLNLSLNSSYISDTTLSQELMTSGLTIGRSDRQSFIANPGVTYNISERLLGTINYNFNRVLYKLPQFTDYTNQQLGLTFNYLMKNEKTTLTNTNMVRAYLYPGSNIYKTLGVYLGGNHKFREDWELDLLAGININNSSFSTPTLAFTQLPFFVLVGNRIVPATLVTVVQDRVKHTKGTPFFSGSTTRRWTNLTVTAGFTRDQTPSAYGYVVNFTRFYVSSVYNFTERLVGTLGGAYSLSTQASQAGDQSYTYYNVTGRFAYQITEKFSITPGYQFTQYNAQYSGQSVSTSAHAHSAYVMLSYSYPIHYQK